MYDYDDAVTLSGKGVGGGEGELGSIFDDYVDDQTSGSHVMADDETSDLGDFPGEFFAPSGSLDAQVGLDSFRPELEQRIDVTPLTSDMMDSEFSSSSIADDVLG